MQLPFVTLDVFTETRFRGNPLAVVSIPAAGPKPSHEQKQAIAREFNLSETVFVHDVEDPAADTTRRIDIFLPFAEIAFAGHPTIGAAVSLLGRAHVTTLVTRAGPVSLSRDGERFVRAAIPHNVHLHSSRVRDLRLPEAQLPADADVRALELDAPVFSICQGVTYALIELPSLEMLSRVRQPIAVLSVDELLDDGWRSGFLGRYYYVRTSSSVGDDGLPIVSLRTRMMENSLEDPATGSAASCLGAFLSTVSDRHDAPTRRYDITQGVEMGKESNIVVDVELKDSQIQSIKLAGTAVQVMSGHLEI
ncbi:hypothetical protein HIM_07437 [Hirsutella minnesotensis 3608]|uniref:Phenazine biosynthesis protein n=1 Tax=Hirsutella minnesotensis 3608 TaxID=1043627 RepID=A0A0F7ZN71_9HYPO|nr:hypothetical protein HIM_07437 [Hirsutella minnesotensis 3608]